jgi:Zn finger protein HypA/HybF involved in hydrogenase expression
MAPTLLGEHIDLRCPNCRLPFPFDSHAAQQKGRQAKCPNCRFSFEASPAAAGRIEGGTQVEVNKFLYRFRKPRRWEPVAFRFPFLAIHCLSCGERRQNVPQPSGQVRCPKCGSPLVLRDQKLFIKRLIGLPGEEVAIRHGHIYADGVLQRKPHELRERFGSRCLTALTSPTNPFSKSGRDGCPNRGGLSWRRGYCA